MKLELKKYRKITSLAKRYNFKEFDLITKYGLFSGNQNLFKTLTIFKLIDEVKKVKGDIIELGIFQGNTSLLIKKILDIFKIKKKLYLLDHFKGLKHFQKEDDNYSVRSYKKWTSKDLVSPKNLVKKFLDFFNFKNVFFFNKDATTLDKNYFKKYKFSLAYFDMDLYEPTLKGLIAIDNSIAKGGIIVFDEGHKKFWQGEKKAIKDFLKINKNYKYKLIDKRYQPDVVLKKIK